MAAAVVPDELASLVDRAFDALCRAYGAIRVDDSGEWLEHLAVLGAPRRPTGSRTVLLTNGHETEWNMDERRWPNLIADNVLDAANLIVVNDELKMSEFQHP